MNRRTTSTILFILIIAVVTISTGSVIAIDNDATSQGLDDDGNDDSTYEWLAQERNENSDYAYVEDYDEVIQDMSTNPQYLFSGGISSETTENLQKTSEKLEQRVDQFDELEDTESIYDELEALNSEQFIYRSVEGRSDERVARFTTEEGYSNFDRDNISFEQETEDQRFVIVQYEDGNFTKQIDSRLTSQEYSRDDYYAEEPETSVPEDELREIEELLNDANSQANSERFGSTGDRSYSDEPHSDVQTWNQQTITGLDSYGNRLESETDEYSGGPLVPEHRVGEAKAFPENCESDSCAVTGIHASIASFTSTWVHLERKRNSALTEDNVSSETVVYREEIDAEDDVKYTFDREIPFETENLRREPYSRQFDNVIYSGDEEYLIDRIPRNGEYTIDSYYSETRTQTPEGTEETNEDLDDVSTRLAPDEGQMTIMYDSGLQSTPEEDIPDEVSTGDTRTVYENTSVEMTNYNLELDTQNPSDPVCDSGNCKIEVTEEQMGDRSIVLSWELGTEDVNRELLTNRPMQFELSADFEHTTTRVIDEATVTCEEFERPEEGESSGDIECIDETVDWDEVSRTDVTLNETTVSDSKNFEFSKYELLGAEEYSTVQKANFVGENKTEYSVALDTELTTAVRPEGGGTYYEPWDSITVGSEELKSQWSYFSSRTKYWDQLVEMNKNSSDEKEDLEKIYQTESDGVFSSPYRPLTTHAYPEYGIYNTEDSSAQMTRISELENEQKVIYSPALQVHESCRQNWPHAEEEGVENSEPCYWGFTSSGDQVKPPEFTEYVHEEITPNNYQNYIKGDNYYSLFQAKPEDGEFTRWVYRNTGFGDTDSREPVMYAGSYIQPGGAVFEVSGEETGPPQLSPITSDNQQELPVDSTTTVYESRVTVEEINQCGLRTENTQIPKIVAECVSSDSVNYISNYAEQFVAYEVTVEGLPLTEEEKEAIKNDPERSLEDEWVPISTEQRDESLIVQGGITLTGTEFEKDQSEYEIFSQNPGNVDTAFDRKSRYSTDSDGKTIVLVRNSRWDSPEYSMSYDSNHWKTLDSGEKAYQSSQRRGTVPSESRSYAFEQMILEIASLFIVIYMIVLVHEILFYNTSFYFSWASGIKETVPWWIFTTIFVALILLVIRYPAVREEVLLFGLVIYALKVQYTKNLNRT